MLQNQNTENSENSDSANWQKKNVWLVAWAALCVFPPRVYALGSAVGDASAIFVVPALALLSFAVDGVWKWVWFVVYFVGRFDRHLGLIEIEPYMKKEKKEKKRTKFRSILI